MTELAHRLNKRFMLCKAETTSSGTGAFERDYIPIRKVWGELIDLTDREIWFDRQGSESGSVTRITLRPAPDIKVHLFLKHLSKRDPERIFRIDKLIQPEPDELIATCSEMEQSQT